MNQFNQFMWIKSCQVKKCYILGLKNIKKTITIRKFIFGNGTRILKKIESYCSSREESTKEEKVNVVSELRLTYSLKLLLKIYGLVKSVYYYTLSKTDKDEKSNEIIDKIKEILFKYLKGIYF